VDVGQWMMDYWPGGQSRGGCWTQWMMDQRHIDDEELNLLGQWMNAPRSQGGPDFPLSRKIVPLDQQVLWDNFISFDLSWTWT
jgi:hypothetical protein